MSEKKKERCFFVAIAILFLDIFNDVGNAVASVDELTRDRFEFALVEKIAVNVADVGNTGFTPVPSLLRRPRFIWYFS